MERVPLSDFVQSWSGTAQPVRTSGAAWQSFLRNEQADNWALVIRRKP
jgi:hypothetical protein